MSIPSNKSTFLKNVVGPNCDFNGDIISAFSKTPRELFVDEAFKYKAYKDFALPIGSNQTISKPSTVAIMINQLKHGKCYNVLEIGTGSGYQTAILSRIFEQVYTVEILPQLYARATYILKKLFISNVSFKISNGWAGWPDFAPFDNIIISASLNDVPKELISQLRVGGIIVLPLSGFITKIVKKDDLSLEIKRISGCKFVDFVLE
jgi:protein-L-isoaspartate(D-aspartate) O-methyltransferase